MNNLSRSQRNSMSPIGEPRKSHIVIRSYIYNKSPVPTRATNTPNTSQVNLNKSILKDPDTSFSSKTSAFQVPQQPYLKIDQNESGFLDGLSPLNSARRKILPPIKERVDSFRRVSFQGDEKKSHSLLPAPKTHNAKPQNNSFQLLVDRNGAIRAFTNIVETGKNEEKEKPVIEEPQKPKKYPKIKITPEFEKIIYQMSLQQQKRGSRRLAQRTFATIDHYDNSRTSNEETTEELTLEERIKFAESQVHRLQAQLKEIKETKNRMKASMVPIRKAVESDLADIQANIFEGIKRMKNDAELENLSLQQNVLKSKLVFENVNNENIELTQTINKVRNYMDRLETEILGNKLTLPDNDDDTRGEKKSQSINRSKKDQISDLIKGFIQKLLSEEATDF